MKHIVIAPVGPNINALFTGIREFPTERVILISPNAHLDLAKSAMVDLQRFNVPAQLRTINGNLYESMFEAVADIRKLEGEKNLLINVATGDPQLRCAATSAAFVNGIRAFSADETGTMMLPVLQFSYYKILTDKKLDILNVLRENGSCASLDHLSKKTGMSLPLISYHINGNLKSMGLKELGLIETKEEKGKIAVRLSTMGNLLIKGHLS